MLEQLLPDQAGLIKTNNMKLPTWQRTKIICTLGPATDAPGVVERLIGAGMDMARVNLSHGNHTDQARRIAEVRQAARNLGQPLAILTDLPGPKFRLGTLEQGVRALAEGTSITLSTRTDNRDFLPVRNRALFSDLNIGDLVYLADGSVELRVTASGPEHAACEVLVGGEVSSGSGINVPEADFDGLVPTDEDRRHISFALAQEADWIGVSFVQSAEDLARVRACFPQGKQALLMAKIEKRRAVKQLDAIIESADGVMVARGDLGVETDLAEIPLLQKRIIAVANAWGRPVVTATQMLESMVHHERPTRAEVTDVANAVLDGTDAVMLSGETAIGLHPVAAVKLMGRVLTATEREHVNPIATERLGASATGTGDALGYAACQLAARIGAKAIIVIVDDFAMAAGIARSRPAMPLLMFAASQTLCQQLMVLRGVAPLYSAPGTDVEQCLDGARSWLVARELASSGSRVVLLLASVPGQCAPDTLRVAQL